MEILQAIVLGLIQGLTEFIPISSSGHLVLVREFFGWTDSGFLMDSILHLGTLVAIILYFWKDILKLFQDALNNIKNKDKKTRKNIPFLYLILITSIPAGLVGFFFEDFISNSFRNTIWVSLFLLFTAIALLMTDKISQKIKKPKKISQMSYLDALVIGLFQVLALLPGVSRSGITMTGGVFRHLSRSNAAKYSFISSIFIIAGAGLSSLLKIFTETGHTPSTISLIVGFIVSGSVGYLCIKFLLKYLQKNNFSIFSYYLIVLSCILLITQFI